MSDSTIIDTSGLLCPLPVIRTQDAIKGMQPGERITVIATDPGTQHDIPAWVRVHGHVLIAQTETDRTFQFQIEVTEA